MARPQGSDPTFIYGTAWKKDATTRLVTAAFDAGFRAFDTANQRKHYDEALVGDALAGIGPRDALYLQTKFTPVDGQDHRVPYDPASDLATQVRDSFASSLEHLHTDYVDSYLLHGPYSFPHLGREDWEVWAAIEDIHLSGRARRIGVSNVNAGQMRALTDRARVAPMIVQNRCFASRGWDRQVREVCRANDITYQAFSLLTANPLALRHPDVRAIAARLGVGPEQVIFRFAAQMRMVPLTGTSDPSHMRADLGAADLALTPDEVRHIEFLEFPSG